MLPKLVLDQGIDFDKCRAWADNKPKSAEYEAAMEALYGYVTEQKNTVQRDGPTMGGNVSMSPHADDRSTLKNAQFGTEGRI